MLREQRREEEAGLQEEYRDRAVLAGPPRGRDWDGVGGYIQGHQGHHHGQDQGEGRPLKICGTKCIVSPCLLYLKLNEL